jgi:hypothetical protein
VKDYCSDLSKDNEYLASGISRKVCSSNIRKSTCSGIEEEPEPGSHPVSVFVINYVEVIY